MPFFSFFQTTLEEKKKVPHLLSFLQLFALSFPAKHATANFFQLIYLAKNEPRTKCNVLYCTAFAVRLEFSFHSLCQPGLPPPPPPALSGLLFHVNHRYIGYIARFLSSNEHKSSYVSYDTSPLRPSLAAFEKLPPRLRGFLHLIPAVFLLVNEFAAQNLFVSHLHMVAER